MTDEKRLPEDESAKRLDDGPIPPTRDGRIKLVTEKGGLKLCPASFSDEYLDWEIIKSDNPFEVLYLDYRAYERISRAVIDNNFTVIKKFWMDTAAKAMSSPPVAKKYGGIDAIRRYPQVLQRAYTELTVDANAPKQCFEQVVQKKQESLRSEIENLLRQGEYTPDIGRDIRARGKVLALTEGEISALLLEMLKEKGFKTERENSDDPLSEYWYSPEKWAQREQARLKQGIKELDSVIEGILADGAYEPRELSAIKEKGGKLGYSEKKALNYLEGKLREHLFSPDPDANITDTDAVHKKLSVIWRTDEKHLEVAISKFRTFLDGKLNNGIYNPTDNVSITEAAPGYLKRDALKQKEILIDYLREKGFKPVDEFRPGHDLAVLWKMDWVSIDDDEEELPEEAEHDEIEPKVSLQTEAKKLEDGKPKKNKFVRIVAAIIILAAGYFVYTNYITSPFLRKIDQALSEKKYLSPSGNNVADIYRAEKAKAPNSPELQQAVSRIRQKLEPMGEDAFQQFYSDSIVTDWDNTVNIYKLLSEMLPDDRDMAAKAEFCQAHQIITGRGRKNYADAFARYQKALELKPNWVFAINGIAKVYIRKDSPYYNKDEALNWYNKASEADPKFPWAYTNIAAIYMEDKQWDMAEQALLNALKIKNNSASIFTELGKACEKQDKSQDAKNYYQEAMKYEKDSDKIAWLQKKISAIQ